MLYLDGFLAREVETEPSQYVLLCTLYLTVSVVVNSVPRYFTHNVFKELSLLCIDLSLMKMMNCIAFVNC